MIGVKAGGKGLNKWMIAFFVMAIIFEFTRELLVVEANSTPTPNTSGVVSIAGSGDYVSANGEWIRTDSGEPLERVPTTIECRKRLGACIESSVNVFPDAVMAPRISIHEANFTDDAITWTDDFPWCVTYHVRIDLKSQKITAERRKKPLANLSDAKTLEIDKLCSAAENLITTELKKSNYNRSEIEKEHFVPFLRLLKAIFS